MADERWHGTRRGYDIHRCRCSACRACNADRVARWRAARPQRRPHPWRERVLQEFYAATQAWWEAGEAVALGYGTELEEYREQHPPPRFRDFLTGMAAQW